jgi:16S rRNA (uracil1498-N3)-methyltransferase
VLHEDKHHFALYWAPISSATLKAGTSFVLDDELLVHRITKVLRLMPPETCTLFDENIHCSVQLVAIEKRSVVLKIIAKNNNQQLAPSISCILPLLKREALEQAVYNLVEIGVNEIQLILTQKTHRAWSGQNEFERIHKIMIAAAEQAKQFSVPKIYQPIGLQEYLQKKIQNNALIFFDTNGISLAQWFKEKASLKTESISLLIGPEGDLTKTEKDAVQAAGAHLVSLTPTILRAQQAITLGAGAIRSLLSPDTF